MPGTADHYTGATLWLTGLPAAGKSTLAQAVAKHLDDHGRRVEVLDGDDLRTNLSADLGFSSEDRDTHVRRVGFVAQLLASHDVIVLVPVIAPYAHSRTAVHEHHSARRTPFLEVHVATPLDECVRRDPKGLYAQARTGRLSGLTGVDDAYEPPEEPHLRINTAESDTTAASHALCRLLDEHGVLTHPGLCR